MAAVRVGFAAVKRVGDPDQPLTLRASGLQLMQAPPAGTFDAAMSVVVTNEDERG
jgi:hypothetical protein